MFDFASLVKYLLEGLAVAVAAYLIPRKTVDPKEIALIALTAAAVFAVLDQFAPLVGQGARQGAGFGIGFSQVGMGHEGFDTEGYDDTETDAAEGFEAKDVCKMDGDQCGYSQEATDDDKAKYACVKDGDKCDSVVACAYNKEGVCAMDAKARGMSGAAECVEAGEGSEKACRLKHSEKEGFDSQVGGFEGFAKVF